MQHSLMDCHVQNVDKQSDEQREAPHECHEGRLFIRAHLVQKSSFSALLCEITRPMKCNLSLEAICGKHTSGEYRNC